MIPFNLEAAKRGEPIVTRDGRPAIFGAHITNFGVHSRLAIALKDGADALFYREDGFFHDPASLCPLDLFMAPVKRTGWIALYRGHKNDVLQVMSGVYDTESGALTDATIQKLHVVAIIPITWEE